MPELTGKKAFRIALVFGVLAATAEMVVILWMAYC
jgi:hypothetical protein